jgi:hypothetical protein
VKQLQINKRPFSEDHVWFQLCSKATHKLQCWTKSLLQFKFAWVRYCSCCICPAELIWMWCSNKLYFCDMHVWILFQSGKCLLTVRKGERVAKIRWLLCTTAEEIKLVEYVSYNRCTLCKTGTNSEHNTRIVLFVLHFLTAWSIFTDFVHTLRHRPLHVRTS